VAWEKSSSQSCAKCRRKKVSRGKVRTQIVTRAFVFRKEAERLKSRPALQRHKQERKSISGMKNKVAKSHEGREGRPGLPGIRGLGRGGGD